MPQDLRTWDSIPLINIAWLSSFGQINKNKITIVVRRWNALNRALLADSDICTTISDEKRDTEETSEDFTLSDAVVHGVIDLSTDSPT